MGLKMQHGDTRSRLASHTIFDKAVTLPGKDNMLDLSSLPSGTRVQTVPLEKLLMKAEKVKKSVRTAHSYEEYCSPGGGSRGLLDPWAQSCSIVSLMTIAQVQSGSWSTGTSFKRTLERLRPCEMVGQTQFSLPEDSWK